MLQCSAQDPSLVAMVPFRSSDGNTKKWLQNPFSINLQASSRLSLSFRGTGHRRLDIWRNCDSSVICPRFRCDNFVAYLFNECISLAPGPRSAPILNAGVWRAAYERGMTGACFLGPKKYIQ